MATDSTHLLSSDTGVDSDTDMSAGGPDLGSIQLAAATGDAPKPVNVPNGAKVVVIPVQPGQTVELPTDSPDGLLAKLGADGNLAIVVDGRTIILQGYAAANEEAPIKIVTSDGDVVDVVEVLASTMPDLDIQTAAGPAAAGAQAGTDSAGSGIFVPFAAGALLGGFDAAGVLGATQLAYKNIDDQRILFTHEEGSADDPDGDIDVEPETVVGEVSFAGGFEDWQPNQDSCEPPVAPMALKVTFTPADNEVLLTLKLSGFPQGSTLFIGNPTDGVVEPGEGSVPFINVDPASNIVVLTPEQIALGLFLLPPQDASGNIDLEFTATVQDPDGGLIADISGSKEVVIDAVAEDAEITWAKPIENEAQEQPAGFPTDPDTTSAECEPVETHVKVNEDNATDECEHEYEEARVQLDAVPRDCCPIDGEPVYPIGFRADTRDDDGSEGITKVLIAFTENESDDGLANADADQVDVDLGDEATIILNGTALTGAGTIVVDGEISQSDDGSFVAAKITLGYAYTADGLVLTVQGAEVGGNPIDPFAVQSLDLTDMQIELPQHDSDDFKLDVTVTTQELFIDSELATGNNEATHTETLIYNIIPIADGAKIDGGEEGHPEEGCETQKFVEDDQSDPLLHGPNVSETQLEIPVTFATSLTDADGSEGIAEIRIFLSANLGGADTLTGLTFFDSDGELTGGNTTITLNLSGGGTAEFNFTATPNVTGWEITLTPVDPTAILGQNVSLDDLVIKTPIDDSTDIRADFYVTTGEFENGEVIDESCEVGHDCVVYEIQGIVGPAITDFLGKTDFIEDGGKSTEECQDSQQGPLLVDLGGISAVTQDQDGSEAIHAVTLNALPAGFSYTGPGGGALPGTVDVQVFSLENGLEVVQASVLDVGGGVVQIVLPPLVASGYDNVLLLPGQLFVEAPQDFSGDFKVDYVVTTHEFDDDGTGGGDLDTPGSISFHVDPASDEPIVQLEGNKIEGEISFYYEDDQIDPTKHGDDATENHLVVPINFHADVTDASEGLTKFTLFFDGAESGYLLKIDGVTIADGDSNVAVEIDGHTGLASFSGDVLTVVFDTPVPDGAPALQVTDEITLVMPIDDSTDFTTYVKVWSSELDEEGEALDPDGHCTAEDFLPIIIQGVVGPAKITTLVEDTTFNEDGSPDGEDCQDPDQGPLLMPVAFSIAAQDSDGSESIIRFTLDVQQDADDGDGAFVDGLVLVDSGGNALAVDDVVTLTGHLFGDATDYPVEAKITSIDGDGKITFEVITAGEWQDLELAEGQVQVKAPQDGAGDFNLVVEGVSEEHDDDVGLNQELSTPQTQLYTVTPVGDDPTVDVSGNATKSDDSSFYYEDGKSDPLDHGADAGESNLLVPVNFTANVSDDSEGLVKFEIALSGQDANAILQIDGATINDGDTDVAVDIAGHTGKASYAGGVLTILFDAPVAGGSLPLTVTDEIKLKLPIDDSEDFTATVTVYSSELDGQGNALEPGGHCSSEDTLSVTVTGVVGPAVITFSGETSFVEDDGEEGECQNPEQGPLVVDLGGLKGVAQDNDGSEGVILFALKELQDGFAYVDENGDPLQDGDSVELTASEFGGADKAVTGTVSFDIDGNLVITIDVDGDTPSNGWDIVTLNSNQVRIAFPQDFSGELDVEVTVRTQEYDDDGTGGGTFDALDTVSFTIAPAGDDPTVDVIGNDTDDASKFYEDGKSDPTDHGADAGESNLLVPVNFTANVTDDSEGLVKVEIALSGQDSDALLQIDGTTINDGDTDVAVNIAGHGGKASYAGGVLTILFDDPVSGAELPLNVTDEIKLKLPIDDSEDFTAKVTVYSSELDDEGDALEPEGHCSTEDTLTVTVTGVVGPALITGLEELKFEEDGGLKDEDGCQDPEQGPLFMPVAFKIAAQDNDGSESITGFAIDIRQDEADDDDAFVNGLAFVDGSEAAIAVGDKFTVNGWLLGEDPNTDPAHSVEVEITSIDVSGKVAFQVNTAGDWQVLELENGQIQIEAPHHGFGDFELVVDATTEEHDDDGGLNDPFTTTEATGSLVQHYVVDPVNDCPTIDFFPKDPEVTDGRAVVSDEGLTGGIKDSNPVPDDETNDKAVSGTFTVADPDVGDTLTVELLTTGLPALEFGGVAVDWSFDGSVLHGKTGGTDAITVAISSLDGFNYDYTVTLHKPLDHPDDTFEDELSFDITVQVTDSGGATDTALLTVQIEDDAPVSFDPEDTIVRNQAGASIIGDLDLATHIGADGLGEVVFGPGIDGQAAAFKSGGNTVYLFGFGTDTLIATTDKDNPGDVSDWVFKVELDGAGDNYNFTMLGKIDNGSGIVFDDFDNTRAGNDIWVGVDNGPDKNIEDLLLTAINSKSVNTDSDSIGVGNQSVGKGEGVRIDFVNNVTGDQDVDKGWNYDSSIDVKSASFAIAQTNPNGGEVVVRVRAVDETGASITKFDDDTQVNLTAANIVVMRGASQVFPPASGGIQVYSMSDGTVIIDGLKAGDVVTTTSGTVYNRLEITNVDGTDVDETSGKNIVTGDRFDVGTISILTSNSGNPVDLSLDIVLTDGDGDQSASTIDVQLDPAGAAPILKDGDANGNSITGGTGNDVLNGFDGNDTIVSGFGDDKIDGGLGSDKITAGGGNDTVIGGGGNDAIDAGDGDDRVIYDADDGSVAGGASADNNLEHLGNLGDVLDVSGAISINLGLAGAGTKLTGFETVDMSGGTGTAVTLSAADVIALGDGVFNPEGALGVAAGSKDALKIIGDPSDSVILTGGGWFDVTSQVSDPPVGFKVYAHDSDGNGVLTPANINAYVLVENDVTNVTGVTP